MSFNFATLWETVADTVPTQMAVVCGPRRVAWRDYEDRAARLAGAFAAAGLEAHAKVGLYLYNSPEYCETNFAALKLRGVPINVNYRYLDEELVYLFDNADLEAVVFHTSLADRIARVAPQCPGLKLLVAVDDGPTPDGPVEVPRAVAYETLLEAQQPLPRRAPQGDEIYMLYTGGTTGMPKGVMYPFGEFTAFFVLGYPPMIGLEAPADVAALMGTVRERAAAGAPPLVAMSAPPLMHGTGCWLGMMAPHMMGGTAVLLESRGLNAVELWDTVAREGVQHLVIVGDAFARPLLDALNAAPQRWDLSCLRLMISSGAMFSTPVKQGLIDHVPGLTIADLLGSTEGGMGSSIMNKDTPVAETARFALSPTTKVFTEDGHEVRPGSGEVGLVASGGLVPIGYYKDPEKSARTFRVFDGHRYSIPGDMARVAADGSLELLGRGSNCINTGGEKVFPEEVEEALKKHPAVQDALVFGLPDERFGNRVSAVASLRAGASAGPEDILAHVHQHLAGYKVPRALQLVPRVPRAPNGKADYPSARALFEAAAG
ncbi:MAG: AMP-binding protein [Gammaproteobacteria bacterium]|nr:AMP-binding protein [Gammaproteobacteria bacterium]